MGGSNPSWPTKKSTRFCVSCFFFLPDGAISLVQFSAHLFPNLITPPIIDLRVNCKGSTGLCVSGFCGYCRHAEYWGIGQQNADEGVPEHMRMNFFNARLFSNTAYQCAIAIRVDRKTIVVADHEVVPTQIQKGLCVFWSLSSPNSSASLHPSASSGLSTVHNSPSGNP